MEKIAKNADKALRITLLKERALQPCRALTDLSMYIRARARASHFVFVHRIHRVQIHTNGQRCVCEAACAFTHSETLNCIYSAHQTLSVLQTSSFSYLEQLCLCVCVDLCLGGVRPRGTKRQRESKWYFDISCVWMFFSWRCAILNLAPNLLCARQLQ